MPLHKRKPFSLLERPDGLKPEELVFQVRFTKEIFRNYGEYLKRINLYRQRVWTCKITGKSNLTYEEALVSEKQANEKVQQFPKQLMEPVLRDVQFSMLTLRDLVSSIAAKLQERLLEGTEIYGRKNNRIYPCKIVKVIDDEVEKTQYQVAWLDKDKKVTENAVVSGEDLIKKKLPFGRDVLKSFIRESTCRSVPWVIHDKLALKYGISTNPPQELIAKIFSKNGDRKRKSCDKHKEANNGERKRNKLNDDADREIKYPMDDLLMQPAAERPPLSREFKVPMECVGDVLMVWDFCSSYSKLLNLSPFPLHHFENALCHKDSNILLIVESHSALLRLLIKDDGDYFIAIQKKKRKPKITLVTWTDYLCDYLEVADNAELCAHISSIRRGHYGLLDVHAKLGIFLELVTQVLTTNIMREKVDECIQERWALAATRRGEALEEGRKRREANGSSSPQHKQSGRKDTQVMIASGKKLMNVEEKTDMQQRKEYLEREMEQRLIHTNPLGKDRDYNRYWFFRKDSRIFVESCDHKQWGYYSVKNEVDSLMGSLNEKGERERGLKKQLEKHYNKIVGEMQKRCKEADAETEAEVRRSSRVRAPPRDNPARAFLKYVNNLKQD